MSIAALAASALISVAQPEPAVLVVPHWESTPRAIREAVEALGAELENGKHNGYAVLTKKGDVWVCHVWVVTPQSWSNSERLEALGHEMMHCFGFDHE